ncbi:DnaJ domain-containing protein [Christensenellaceae bacterium OttesenSCG-928-K19]|nr:DnaJ domain-containing protein [Christensenellaceae bacterium OttesenSCG-928-K19]
MSGLITICVGGVFMAIGYHGAVWWWDGILVVLGVLMIPIGFVLVIVGIVRAIRSLILYLIVKRSYTKHEKKYAENLRRNRDFINQYFQNAAQCNRENQYEQSYSDARRRQGQHDGSGYNTGSGSKNQRQEKHGPHANQRKSQNEQTTSGNKEWPLKTLDDCYRFLKVPPTASDDEVKRAYYKYAKLYHSDIHNNSDEYAKKEADRYMKLLNDARHRIRESRKTVV